MSLSCSEYQEKVNMLCFPFSCKVYHMIGNSCGSWLACWRWSIYSIFLYVNYNRSLSYPINFIVDSIYFNSIVLLTIWIVSGCAWICLWAFSSILHAISGSASPGCCRHSGHLKTSVRWQFSPYILPSLWGTLVLWVDLLKPYLREGTSSPGYGSLPCF